MTVAKKRFVLQNISHIIFVFPQFFKVFKKILYILIFCKTVLRLVSAFLGDRT